MGAIFVYVFFLLSCVIALVLPAIGCAAFYFFNLLDPAWNWRWAIPEDPGFQKWIALSLLLGFITQQGWRSSMSRTSVLTLGLLLSFLVLCFLSSLNSAYPSRSMFYLDLLWRIVLIVAISLVLTVTENRAMLLAVGCVLGQGYNSFQINLEYFQFGYCRYAMMTNWGLKGLDNNGYSILTVPILAISIAFALTRWKWWLRGIAAGICLLQIHQIMLMESRGSMLGALLAASLAVWYCPKSPVTNTILILGATLVVLLAGPPVVREFTSSFASEGDMDASAESRFYLWKAGAAIIWEYPWFGVGPGCSSAFVPLFYDFGALKAQNEKALHNLFFEIMCENGIIAGTIYFSFFLLPWGMVWFNRRRFFLANPKQCALALGVIAGTPGYLLASMFSSGSLIESSYVLPIIGCALLGLKPASQPNMIDTAFPANTSETGA
jgi:O-antigen ligase